GMLPEHHTHDPMRTVNLMGPQATTQLDVCRSDSVSAVYEGFRHLLELGYRRIGLILLSHSPANAGRDLALAEYGIEVDDRLTGFFDSSNSGLEDDVNRMLDLGDPPDALVAYNVSGTPIVLRALKRRGLVIGTDIGFIGTEAGRTDWGDLLSPQMTALHIPAYRIGAVGAERLIARLRGEDSPPQTIEFPARLVVRESTPPR
ncbi:MAG TPA: substrate-binding domain-containing protein, partial [Thermomicrobiales bacterium]|nr:substrate-binding domain-containing protein [Thermomicrobiales bacterium]